MDFRASEDPLYRLSQSDFRRKFHLDSKDMEYIDKKGMDVIRDHAADFVLKRLASAEIPNDGRQTPFRGHPVFKAQHASACCCRGCMQAWHGIPKGRALTKEEQSFAVDLMMEWIRRQMEEKKSKR
ncbi:MAG: DUF4186 domain-containing protein [Eubacteriales bacterium]|nr:DUF4186 domain-containing protein [Eubacteriales bacterium]